MIDDDRYEYKLGYVNKDGQTVWLCNCCGHYQCKGKVTTYGLKKTITVKTNHDHEPVIKTITIEQKKVHRERVTT